MQSTNDLQPGSFVLKNNTLKDEIKQRILNIFNLSDANADYLPASLPVSIERNNFQSILDDDYVVTEKTDGVRYMLFLTYHRNMYVSMFIDRAFNMWDIIVTAKKSYFHGNGSLFDGELVWEYSQQSIRPTQVFLVFDVMSISGDVTVQKDNYMKRLSKIYDIFHSFIEYNEGSSSDVIVCTGNNHNLTFKPKQCFRKDNISTLHRLLGNLNHKTDGLVFTPVNCPVICGTHSRMYKWKSAHMIDLFVSVFKNDNMWNAECEYMDKGKLVNCETNPVTIRERSQTIVLRIEKTKMLHSLFNYCSMKGLTNIKYIFECSCKLNLHSDFVWCRIIKPRHDKLYPNSKLTIEKTLWNIIESISINEMIELLSKN